MVVDVTQEHIDSGFKDDGFRCPFARALRPHIKLGLDPYVGSTVVYIYDSESYCVGRLNLPQKVTDFIVAYDKEFPVQPFTAEVMIPVEYR